MRIDVAGHRDASPGAALAELLAALRPRLARLFFRLRVPPADAEDVLQDALFVLVSRWEAVEDPEGFLYGTVRNRCWLYHRRQRCRERHLEPLSARPPAGREARLPPPQERLERQLDLAALLANLDQRDRRRLRLRYVAGMSYEELAAAEPSPRKPETVRRALTRTVAELRQLAHGKPARRKPRGQ